MMACQVSNYFVTSFNATSRIKNINRSCAGTPLSDVCYRLATSGKKQAKSKSYRKIFSHFSNVVIRNLPAKKPPQNEKALNFLIPSPNSDFPKSLGSHLLPDDIQRAAGFKPLYLLCIISMVYRERFCRAVFMVQHHG